MFNAEEAETACKFLRVDLLIGGQAHDYLVDGEARGPFFISLKDIHEAYVTSSYVGSCV